MRSKLDRGGAFGDDWPSLWPWWWGCCSVFTCRSRSARTRRTPSGSNATTRSCRCGVSGNIESGVFVIFNHGGPGSSGTLESIIEANPGDGQLGQASPLKALEDDYAVVYWDQRHSGLSKGDADPNDSQPDDFGLDLVAVVEALEDRYAPDSVFLVGQSWGHFVAMNYLTSLDSWESNQAMIDGYIGYKGNHEQSMAYEVAREALIVHAESQIDGGQDVERWQGAIDFYEARPTKPKINQELKAKLLSRRFRSDRRR